MKDKSYEIQPFLCGLNDQISLSPRQFDWVVAEFGLTIEICPHFTWILASEHNRSYFLYLSKTWKLSIREHIHFHCIFRQSIVRCMFELNKVDGQPKVVDLLVYMNMHVRNTVQVDPRDEIYVNNLSALASRRNLINFLLYFEIEIFELILIVETHSLRPVSFIIDIKYESNFIHSLFQVRSLKSNFYLLVSDQHQWIFEESDLVSCWYFFGHIHNISWFP